MTISHKALIIIGSTLGVMVVALSVVIGLYLWQGAPNDEGDTTPSDAQTFTFDPAQQESQTVPDLSTDLGACTTVSAAMITSALQPVALTPGEADNRGVGFEGEGSQSQSCVYRFNEGPALIDRLTITVTTHPTLTVRDAYIEGLEDTTPVEAIQQAAYFISSQTDDENRYMLVVAHELRTTSFLVQQPTEMDVFDSASAREVLVTLATQATYES